MWFAALDPYGNQAWLRPMLDGLLENSATVLGLLDETGNPFPDDPPRYVRLMLYRYEFTTPDERLDAGAWWQRGVDCSDHRSHYCQCTLNFCRDAISSRACRATVLVLGLGSWSNTSTRC